MTVKGRFMFVLLVLTVACAQPPPPAAPLPDLAAEERAIRAADARWLTATKARDAAGEAAVFASDGIAYRPHLEPLVGPAAFQAYNENELSESPKGVASWTTDAVHVAASGDLAVQTGTFEANFLGPKADGRETGRFLTVWKKVNGDWKVAHDMGSTTMPDTRKR